MVERAWLGEQPVMWWREHEASCVYLSGPNRNQREGKGSEGLKLEPGLG